MQPLAGITHHRFSLIRVRSPLLTESLLFSLPEGTEMFHFPPFPPHTLYIQVRVTALDKQRGFPIRTPSDHSPVIDSPRLIADSHVLHRLLVPRHPPCALNDLHTNDHHKGIHINNHQGTHPQQAGTPRCSRPLYSSQTTTHHTTPNTPNQEAPSTAHRHQDNNHTAHCLKTQQCTLPSHTTTPQRCHHATTEYRIPPMSKPPAQHSCTEVANQKLSSLERR
jgi:hypothetical protein